jgi:hypothetical protein
VTPPGCGKFFGSAYVERNAQRTQVVADFVALLDLATEKSVTTEPVLSAEVLLEQLRGRFQKLCLEVTAAVNAAPAGQIINHSEEKVRDLLAVFRQATFEAAIQLRTDAAQAAFPPSSAPPDRLSSAEQGPR